MAIIVKNLCFSFIILASFAALFAVANARRFYVGGNGDWVINPKENYNTWAGRNRFQVNDTIYFKYAKGSDSVQQVTKANFDGCNISNPIKKFDNGESEFTFDRSGPFYFISGNQDHCKKGQKLIVVVLAIRHQRPVPISPAKPPNSPSPVSPAKPPSMIQPPKSSSPPPSISPSRAPTVSPTNPSPSPTSLPPAPSPANTPSSLPSPDQSPNSPSPSDATPASSDNVTSPAPSNKNSSASGLAVTSSVMTIVLSVVLTVFMFV